MSYSRLSLYCVCALAFLFPLVSCGGKVKASGKVIDSDVTPPAVEFDADSAYSFVARQVEFGPRVPGSVSHVSCGDYIVETLRRLNSDTVIEQNGEAVAYNGDRLPVRNIMAMYNAGARRRILLLAHWDTRPWADQDAEVSNRDLPIPGANDGASGVGVLLEIARCLSSVQAEVGVDLLFVDAEDYGRKAGDMAAEGDGDDDSWCLGTQMWIRQLPYGQGVRPAYGMLLDMVGGKNAVFYREYFSEQYAPQINNKVWSEARSAGYGSRFVDQIGGAVTDDHIYVNRAAIPAVDIIEMAHPATGSFNPTWHTMDDNLDNIDRNTLKMVGQVVLNVIYKEKNVK